MSNPMMVISIWKAKPGQEKALQQALHNAVNISRKYLQDGEDVCVYKIIEDIRTPEQLDYQFAVQHIHNSHARFQEHTQRDHITSFMADYVDADDAIVESWRSRTLVKD